MTTPEPADLLQLRLPADDDPRRAGIRRWLREPAHLVPLLLLYPVLWYSFQALTSGSYVTVGPTLAKVTIARATGQAEQQVQQYLKGK